MDFIENLKAVRVVPVIVIKDLGHAVPLAKALVEGGLNVLEITLRSPVAMEAIRTISGEVEGAIVGAGTVINAEQLVDAADAGAELVVGPPRPRPRRGAPPAANPFCRCYQAWPRHRRSCMAFRWV